MNAYNTTTEKKEMEDFARRRIQKTKRFYTHFGIYGLGLMVFVLKEYFNAPFNFPPLHLMNWFLMACWTFVLVVQGLKLFLTEVILGSQWENRKMEKIMKSELDNQKK